MAVVSLQAESATFKLTEFDRLERAWRYAKAQWELAENDPSHDGLDCDEGSEFCDAEHEAFLAMMLHPTSDPRELARKLRIFYRQQAWGLGQTPAIVDRIQKDMGKHAFGWEG
jgi:hypothetical protein